MKKLPDNALVRGSVINDLIDEINRNKITGVQGLELRQSAGGTVLSTRDYTRPDRPDDLDDLNNYELPPSMILRSWFGVVTAYYNFDGSDEAYDLTRGRYEYEVTLTNTFGGHSWWQVYAGGIFNVDVSEAVMSDEWATSVGQGRIFVKAYNVIESLRPIKTETMDLTVSPPVPTETTSGLHGNGVDTSDEGNLPATMRVQPVPLGTVIIVHEMKTNMAVPIGGVTGGFTDGNMGDIRPTSQVYPNKNMTSYTKGYYFSYCNGIDGSCL